MTGLLIYINNLNPHKVGILVSILRRRTYVQNTDVLLVRGGRSLRSLQQGVVLTPSWVTASLPPSHRKKRLAELHLQVNCFSLLWKIYSLNYFFHYKYYAYLVALMEMNAALETQDDFQVGGFCSCFLNFCISFGKTSLARASGVSESQGPTPASHTPAVRPVGQHSGPRVPYTPNDSRGPQRAFISMGCIYDIMI